MTCCSVENDIIPIIIDLKTIMYYDSFFMQAPEMDFHYIGMQSNGICSTRGQQGTIRFLNKRLLELSKLSC